MALTIAVISAIVPGVLWLWVFTHGRSYRNAPLKILLISFFLGMLSVIPAGIIEFFVLGDDDDAKEPEPTPAPSPTPPGRTRDGKTGKRKH